MHVVVIGMLTFLNSSFSSPFTHKVSQITDDWLVALENNDGGHPLEGKISIPCDIEEADGRKIHVDFQGERPPRNAGEWIGTISLRSKLSNR